MSWVDAHFVTQRFGEGRLLDASSKPGAKYQALWYSTGESNINNCCYTTLLYYTVLLYLKAFI